MTDVAAGELAVRDAEIERLEGLLASAEATVENLRTCHEQNARELHAARERIAFLEAQLEDPGPDVGPSGRECA